MLFGCLCSLFSLAPLMQKGLPSQAEEKRSIRAFHLGQARWMQRVAPTGARRCTAHARGKLGSICPILICPKNQNLRWPKMAPPSSLARAVCSSSVGFARSRRGGGDMLELSRIRQIWTPSREDRRHRHLGLHSSSSLASPTPSPLSAASCAAYLESLYGSISPSSFFGRIRWLGTQGCHTERPWASGHRTRPHRRHRTCSRPCSTTSKLPAVTSSSATSLSLFFFLLFFSFSFRFFLREHRVQAHLTIFV